MITLNPLDTGYICPVSGNNLKFKACEFGEGSREICPCCGTQFGYYDAKETLEGKIARWKYWRDIWMQNGMKCWSGNNKASEDWNPEEQLKNIPKEYL